MPPTDHAQPRPAAEATASVRQGAETIGPMRLFTAFSGLALSGFGGVLPFAYRALVERRKWLDAREFASLLAIAQVMPGPTICNLSVMIGQRYAGFAGACAALSGMVLGPSCIVIALGIAWQRYGDLTAVKQALAGMSAVAIGLIFATAVKMGISLFRPDPGAAEDSEASARGETGALEATPARSDRTTRWARRWTTFRTTYWTTQRIVQVALCVAGLVGVGFLRWPLVAVVAGLAPIAVAVSYWFDH